MLRERPTVSAAFRDVPGRMNDPMSTGSCDRFGNALQTSSSLQNGAK